MASSTESATDLTDPTDVIGAPAGAPPAALPRQGGPAELERRALPPRPAPLRRTQHTALGSTPRWAIDALASTVAVLMLGVGAIVAVPFFMGQRDRAEWADTVVALPRSVEGRNRNGAAPIQRMLGTQLTVNRLTERNVGVYGPLDLGVVVVMAAKTPERIEDAEQLTLRNRVVAGFAAAGGELRLSEVRAGKLGGWFGCGKANTGLSVCVGTDHSSLAVVMMGPEVKDPEAVARRTREATVVR